MTTTDKIHQTLRDSARYALDGVTAFSFCYVLFIYFYGHTFTY